MDDSERTKLNKQRLDAVDLEEVRAISEKAYIFAYPMLQVYRTMYVQAINSASPVFRAPFNQFSHSVRLLGPQNKTVVRPNNDTLYSAAWLDLRTEPVVASVPAIEDRYYSFQLVDMYTHNLGYIGTRTTGTAVGSYLIAGPDWQRDDPGVARAVFRSEGSFVLCLVRTAVVGEDDLPAVLAIQQQYRVRPLSAALGEKAPAARAGDGLPPYQQTAAESADFIRYFNALLGHLVIHPSEQGLLARFGRIGIGPGRAFEAARLDPAIRQAIDGGVVSAITRIKGFAAQVGEQKNGWLVTKRIFGNRAQMQGQYLTRAAGAYLGLFGNDLEEAYYPNANQDTEDDPLNGAVHNYVLKFARDEIPAVDAFWSITMYGLPEQQMVANPINRYSIGDGTKGLVYGPDGSLEIYLQHDRPDKEREPNWLPAPNGPFAVTMRMYLPKASALAPLYAPPGIQKRD
jgi:hypothetical protein